MATDDERRAVARRLREMAGDGGWVHTESIQKALGLETHPMLIDGSLYTSASVSRLADLIEPGIDREMLLEAADDACPSYKEEPCRTCPSTEKGCKAACFEYALWKVAHRIREVLGVEP